MLTYAIITINLALLFYTIGVWAEKKQGVLKKWHLIIFWLGFAFDTIGTTLMTTLSTGNFRLNFHGITGFLAIMLMFLHAVWATVVLASNQEQRRKNFHRFSIVVWCIWLIPFISGMLFAMVGTPK
jgi:uncharacterized repeat protein (TIGR03987 family)